jgi:outer membrane protein assembly factor BamB
MPTGGAVESSPAVGNGVVFVGSDDGNVYGVAAAGCGAATCSPLWTATTGGPVQSSPAISGGEVYIGSSDHEMHVYQLPGASPTGKVKARASKRKAGR